MLGIRASKGILSPLAKIERKDHIPDGVIRAYPVVDPDQKQIWLIGSRFGIDIPEISAGLISHQRLLNVMNDIRECRGIVRSKDQLMNPAAKIWKHDALAFGRAQNEIN